MFAGIIALSSLLLVALSIRAQDITAWLDVSPEQVKQGDTVRVEVMVDLSQVSDKLGAYEARLGWDPGVLKLVEVSDGETPEFANPQKKVGSAEVVFSNFSVSGAGGVVSLLKLRFEVVGGPDEVISLSLSFEVLDAAGTFENLLPKLQVKPFEGITIEQSLKSFEITLDTEPSGICMVVDDTSYSSPVTFVWEEGTSHTVEVPFIGVISDDCRYKFAGWRGKVESADTLISIEVDSASAGTYKAIYKRQYRLDFRSEPSDVLSFLSIPSADDAPAWYDEGRKLELSAPGSIDSLGFMCWVVKGDTLKGSSVTVDVDTSFTVEALYAPVEHKAVLSVVDGSGSPGGVGDVSICLENEVEVAGVEFVLSYDPEVLSLDSVRVTPRTEDMDILSWNITEPGRVKVMLADVGGDFIYPDSCCIVEVSFRVSSDANPGDSVSLRLSDVVLSDREGASIGVRVEGGVFRISGIMGDVNGDGEVDVRDVIVLVNIILGKVVPGASQFWAGDLNGDGSLDVRDVILLVNRILGRVGKVSKVAGWTGLVRVSGDGEGVLIDVDAPVSLGGVQLELSYDGFSTGEPRLVGRGDGMELAWDCRDGSARILVYSLDGREIPSGDGAIVMIPLAGRVRLEKVVISDREGRGVPVRIGRREVVGAYLWQNVPNPFNLETSIRYYLPEGRRVSLEVLDVLGRRVRKLVGWRQDSGCHTVCWDGRDELGREVSSGIYICRLRFGAYEVLKKMLLVR